MASAFTHAVVGLALGTGFRTPGPPARFWALGAVCAALPDLDVVAFRFGIPYGHMLGHRGLTHSFAFAAALAAAVATLAFRGREWDETRGFLWSYFFLATASHGVLDMMTNGGRGVALFAPLENGRYFLPWRPIEVSPIGVTPFFTERGFEILRSELQWVWAPAIAFALACLVAQRLRRPRLGASDA